MKKRWATRSKIGAHVHGSLSDSFRTKDRISHIFSVWSVRGAHRSIKDFYQAVEVLGEGSYGSVEKWRCLASFNSEDRFVAVKRIKWSSTFGGFWTKHEQESSLRNELRMLIVLDHPFVIKCREWFEDPWRGVYFVMELCTGPSLQNLLDNICKETQEARHKCLPRLRRYFREVTYALSYIHGMDPPVVHRDLKPDNILLKDNSVDSCAKLIDFGLASVTQNVTEQDIFTQGTMLFMSPEQFTNMHIGGDVTEDMDMWALGIIFSWVVTAVSTGSLCHPMMHIGAGDAFNVSFQDLYYAYKSKTPWNRALFAGEHDSAFHIMDRVLKYDPKGRARASELMREPWLKVGDASTMACAEMLRQGGVIKNISSYHKLQPWERKIIMLVADNAADSHVVHLRRTFRSFDTQCNGVLSEAELREGFERNDIELHTDFLQNMFRAVDPDGSGSITYHEFLAVTLGQRILSSEQAVSAAWRNLDMDGTGTITRDELERAVGVQGAKDVLEQIQYMYQRRRIESITYKDFERLVMLVAKKRASLPQSNNNKSNGEETCISIDVDCDDDDVTQEAELWASGSASFRRILRSASVSRWTEMSIQRARKSNDHVAKSLRLSMFRNKSDSDSVAAELARRQGSALVE